MGHEVFQPKVTSHVKALSRWAYPLKIDISMETHPPAAFTVAYSHFFSFLVLFMEGTKQTEPTHKCIISMGRGGVLAGILINWIIWTLCVHYSLTGPFPTGET